MGSCRYAAWFTRYHHWAMAHTTKFRKSSPRDKLLALKSEILEDFQKVDYLHVFRGEQEIKISDPWGSKYVCIVCWIEVN